jgi:hypothetical protein
MITLRHYIFPFILFIPIYLLFLATFFSQSFYLCVLYYFLPHFLSRYNGYVPPYGEHTWKVHLLWRGWGQLQETSVRTEKPWLRP